MIRFIILIKKYIIRAVPATATIIASAPEPEQEILHDSEANPYNNTIAANTDKMMSKVLLLFEVSASCLIALICFFISFNFSF